MSQSSGNGKETDVRARKLFPSARVSSVCWLGSIDEREHLEACVIRSHYTHTRARFSGRVSAGVSACVKITRLMASALRVPAPACLHASAGMLIPTFLPFQGV